MNSAAKTYQRHFLSAMALYAVTIFGVNSYLSVANLPQWAMVVLVLVPMLPVLLALKAIITFYRSMDELQKKIQGEAVLIAFLFVGLSTFSYGFLEGVGFPSLKTTWIFPMLIAAWGVALIYVTRKYK